MAPVAAPETLNADVLLATIRNMISAAGRVATTVPRIRNVVGANVALAGLIVRMGRVSGGIVGTL